MERGIMKKQKQEVSKQNRVKQENKLCLEKFSNGKTSGETYNDM